MMTSRLPPAAAEVPPIRRWPLRWLTGAAVVAGTLTLVAYATVAYRYAFWRADTWEYLDSPHDEFAYNYRWLVPQFYKALHSLPSYGAWLCASVLFLLFGYLLVRRWLRNSPWDCGPLAYVIALPLLLNPGIQDQLTWPSHALAAILLLDVMALLLSWVNPMVLVAVGTPLVFAVHQTFAFLTVLFLIPDYTALASPTFAQGMWRSLRSLIWWALSFLLAWGVSQLIVRLYFGHIPGVAGWRNPHPAGSAQTLLGNVLTNLGVMGHELQGFYSSAGLNAAGLLIALGVGYAWVRKQERARLTPLLLVAGVYFSVYVITAPLGTNIPFRLTLIYGPAFAALTCVLLAATRRPLAVMSAALGLTLYPAALSLINMHWFAVRTTEVETAVDEVRQSGTPAPGGVLLDTSEFHYPKGRTEELSRQATFFPRVFATLASPYAFTPAFREAGFQNVVMCGRPVTGPCWRLQKQHDFPHCSASIPVICSGGVTADGFWLVHY